MTHANIRTNSEAGIGSSGPGCLLGGTGGSSSPTPVIFRGGPPPREDEGCGSGSRSNSVNSCGIIQNSTAKSRPSSIGRLFQFAIREISGGKRIYQHLCRYGGSLSIGVTSFLSFLSIPAETLSPRFKPTKSGSPHSRVGGKMIWRTDQSPAPAHHITTRASQY
jgi:hypothetical protein